MAEWFPLPKDLDYPHPGHGSHLCVAHAMNYIQTNLSEYKKLIKNGSFVCRACGRVANKAEYLCAPEGL